jgi:flavorubredoxin
VSKLKAIEIKPDIYWVGGIDWDIRNFHGYITPRGTTYNSYLIVDEKITLVDTVKHYLFDEMLSRISSVIDPKKIDYIVSNHVEMDHSGSIPKILEIASNAELFISPRGKRGLEKHFSTQYNPTVVKTNDTLSIGKRELHFVEIPMVHWPDSMVTYNPYDAILFSNDAFGQHIGSSQRFVDEIGWDIAREEAAKYYANIVMPYGSQVQKALEVVKTLDIDMIAPSHGLIWRTHLENILGEYDKWSSSQSENKALIIYDTMWQSTEKLAHSLKKGIESADIPVTMRNLSTTHISDIISDVLDSKLILIGSPTLNNTMLPTMGGFLTYLKGLRPKNKTGFVFGSFGWGGQAVKEIEQILKDLQWELPETSININYVPTKKDLNKTKKIGEKIAKSIKK